MEELMVTPEVVGHIDPVGWSGVKTNGKPGNRLGVISVMGAALVVGDAVLGGRRLQDDGRAGPVGVIQRVPPYPTSSRTSKPRVSRWKAREASGSSCGRKVQ
ncbi:hypothetical protein [Sphaerisporangium album]|uniref:hypothetical protein n=1 Tax=Sphaerisporangium album TaxID=509200 RepID=UPI0015F0DFFF